jgi:hypothetical protein
LQLSRVFLPFHPAFPKVLLQGVIQAFVSALHLRVGLSWKPWNFLSVSARVLVDAVLAETGKSPSAWINPVRGSAFVNLTTT